MSFTPGPWQWLGGTLFGKDDVLNDDPNAVLYADQIEDDDGDSYAALTFHHTNAEADMALIAAAPDLYEALVAVVAVADRKTDEFDRARAAIAKAVRA